MSIRLNTRILQHITKQISAGKVIWALLTLNEYNLSESDPLVKCLRQKASKAVAANYNNTEIFTAVLAGKKFSELNTKDQAEVRKIDSLSKLTNVYKKNIVLTDYSKRKQLRQTNGNIYFSSPSSLWSSRKRSYALVNSTKREASSGD